MSRATATRISGFHYEVEVDGHTIQVDEPIDEGGTDEGAQPSRLLAAALASCTAMTIGIYADRKGWDVSEVEVAVEYEGSPPPGETARFKIDLGLPASMTDEQRERIEIVAGKCPVHRTLTGPIEVATITRTTDA